MSANRLDSVLHYVRKVVGAQAEQGSDADLLQRFVRHRDETAFELLLWRHAAMVLRVCQGVLRDSHAAEDAFQATFLALARKAASISRSESLAAWLYQVAYRAAVRARLNAVERRALETRRRERAPVASSGDELADRDWVPVVHEEVNRLAAKYRSPLILCYLEGKTHAEAAQQLGWAKGTVSGRLARAREMLKKRLVRRGILFPASIIAVALAATKTSAVPPVLVAATIKAAVAFAAGNVAAAGVSTGVIHLTHGVLTAMCATKLKATSAAVLAFLLIFAGTGALLRIGFVGMTAQGATASHRVPQYTLQPPPPVFDPVSADAEEEPQGPGSAGGAGLPGGEPPPGGPTLPDRPGVDGPGGFPGAPGGPGGPGGFPGGPGGLSGPAGGSSGGPPPAAKDHPGNRKRIDSINNLKQIALALHNYHDTYGFLPTDILDEQGQPLLSWRVGILPYIEQEALYKEFKLDERWDSAHNSKLLGKMPAIYRIDVEEAKGPLIPGGPTMPGGSRPMGIGSGPMMPGGPTMPGGSRPMGNGSGPMIPGGPAAVSAISTYYQGFAGKGAAFDRLAGQLRLADFADGTANTILVVEAGAPVPWSKPQDLPFSAKKPLPALGVFADVIHAAFADGSVHNLRKDFDPAEMRKAIIRNDSEVIDFDKLELPARMGPGGKNGGPAGMFGGPPGMKLGGPAGMAGVPAGMPGGPGGPPHNFDLNRLQAENAKLEQLLQRTAEEMNALRQEVNQVKEQYAVRREQGEAKKLLAEREKMRQQLEAANVELKAMRDELQQLKRGLDKP